MTPIFSTGVIRFKFLVVVFSSVFVFFMFPIKSLLFSLRRSEESVCEQREAQGSGCSSQQLHYQSVTLDVRSALEIFLSSRLLTVSTAAEMSTKQPGCDALIRTASGSDCTTEKRRGLGISSEIHCLRTDSQKVLLAIQLKVVRWKAYCN